MGTNFAALLADLFYTRMRQILCRVSRKQANPPCRTTLFPQQIYRWCITYEKFQYFRVFGIQLSKWTWNQRYILRLLYLIFAKMENSAIGFVTGLLQLSRIKLFVSQQLSFFLVQLWCLRFTFDPSYQSLFKILWLYWSSKIA